MEWKVLGEENGQIIITTATPIKTSAETPKSLYFKGRIGYASFEDELNKICSMYGQGKYADTSKFKLTQDTIVNDEVTGNITSSNNESGARSIKLEDLQLAGYVNTISSQTRSYTKNAATKHIIKDDNAATPEDSVYTVFRYWDEYVGGTKTWKALICPDNSTNVSATLVIPQYSFTTNNLKSTSPAYKMLFKKADGSTIATYWLASRYIGLSSGYVLFRMRTVQGNRIDSKFTYYSFGSDAENPPCMDVRPVVYLQSNISLTFNGNDSNPVYTITTGD